jgi:hypothetical protein
MKSSEVLEVERASDSGSLVSEDGSADLIHKSTALKDKAAIRVFVKSFPALISLNMGDYNQPVKTARYPALPTGSGKRTYIRRNELDSKQQEFLNEVNALAKHLGARIEVCDVGQQNVLQRLVSRITFGDISVPSVILPGSNMSEIERELARSYLGTDLVYTNESSTD